MFILKSKQKPITAVRIQGFKLIMNVKVTIIRREKNLYKPITNVLDQNWSCIHFSAKGKDNLSIRSSILSCNVSIISDDIKRCVSSRSWITNFTPNSFVSSKCSKSCFIAGSHSTRTPFKTFTILKLPSVISRDKSPVLLSCCFSLFLRVIYTYINVFWSLSALKFIHYTNYKRIKKML